MQCDNCYWSKNDTCEHIDGYSPSFEDDEICANLLDKGIAQCICNKAIDDLMDKVAETDVSDRDFKFLKIEAERLKEGGKNEPR